LRGTVVAAVNSGGHGNDGLPDVFDLYR
jgi:hypothetical protein